MIKKVPVFRHLSTQQINDLAKSLSLVEYQQGAQVIKQGEFGTQFFVIKSGEVRVEIDGKFIRTMGINVHFGERTLLLGEQRSATVTVDSDKAVLLVLEKDAVLAVLKGQMLEEVTQRIQL